MRVVLVHGLVLDRPAPALEGLDAILSRIVMRNLKPDNQQPPPSVQRPDERIARELLSLRKPVSGLMSMRQKKSGDKLPSAWNGIPRFLRADSLANLHLTREQFVEVDGNSVPGRVLADLERLEVCPATLDLGRLGLAKILEQRTRFRFDDQV